MKPLYNKFIFPKLHPNHSSVIWRFHSIEKILKSHQNCGICFYILSRWKWFLQKGQVFRIRYLQSEGWYVVSQVILHQIVSQCAHTFNVHVLVFRKAMAGIPSVLSCSLSIFIVSFRLSLTCDQIITSKRTYGPPLYQTQQSSVDASGNLLSCSRWCVETDSCQAISWEPSRCIQVDNGNSGVVVNTSVYVVPKDRGIPGKRSVAFFAKK